MCVCLQIEKITDWVQCTLLFVASWMTAVTQHPHFSNASKRHELIVFLGQSHPHEVSRLALVFTSLFANIFFKFTD